MSVKIGINGFGRIGRQVLKAIKERHGNNLDVVAINDLTDSKTNAHLFKYDSNYGVYSGEVQATGRNLSIDGSLVNVFSEREPSSIPWSDLGIEIVVESTGFFTNADLAKGHKKGTVKKVVISAPAEGEDLTTVLGVNNEAYEPEKHHIISNASCTTNCVAPMAKIINDNFGIQSALMTTIHAYTNDQKILDQVHDDLRRSRAAAMNIIPTTTGAAKIVGKIIPELDGKIHGMALRVPVSTVSITDLTVSLNKKVTADEVNAIFKESSSGEFSGILGYSSEPLVSTDFKANSNSCTIDGLSTMVIGNNLLKVMGWYDNEWGYSCRTADLCQFIVEKGL